MKRRFLLSFTTLSALAILANEGPDSAPGSLRIRWVNPQQLELAWPTDLPAWHLESKTDLSDLQPWSPVTSLPALGDGEHRFQLEPTDAARFFRLRRDPTGGLPPDPGTVAPPLKETELTSFQDATRFLYDADNPIQTGVEPDRIDSRRATVLRGRVFDPEGSPLSGVRVSVDNHPEYGATQTRQDGGFDLVVNGGGQLTIRYSQTAYLPAQRKVDTTANRYCWLPTVRLVPTNAKSTPVRADQPEMQVVQGSRVSDEDGVRTATLIVPGQTRAELVAADGSVQAVGELNIRITEYTVGRGGPEAMPAVLPPASGYTYAAELSADEAGLAGAKEVRFDRPLYHYVENFLGFPVGSAVPAGYYDRDLARWIPANNGRVIAVVDTRNEVANLDTDGDGQPDDAGQLAALGVTDEERRQLATLYSAGQSLWRVPVPHFSPWDYNWPYGPPADAKPPELEPPDDDPSEEDPCEQTGSSIIECQNQVLGERIPLPGTPFSLNYRSDRMPGFRDGYGLRIPLSKSNLPDSVKAIHLDFQVAGQRWEERFPAAPLLAYDFAWDGRDAYGRETQGAQPFLARVGYAYDAVYYEPGELEAAFGAPGTVPMEGIPARQEAILWQELPGRLGPLDARIAGLGGWTLSTQHWLDPLSEILHRGDGRSRKVSSASPSGYELEYYFGFCIDLPIPGMPFSACPVIRSAEGPMPIWDIQVGPDNSLYLFEPGAADGNARVLRISESGRVETVAGGGNPPDGLGDGGTATQARLGLGLIGGIALDDDGSLYITHADLVERDGSMTWQGRVRRVAPNGIISTIAGGGEPSDGLGDGGPATQARLEMPAKLATGPDGSLYISDLEQKRVRRVGPDGLITTVAGTGETTSEVLEGVPAKEAPFDDQPGALVADSEGSLYVVDGARIRRIAPDGRIYTHAGNGERGAVIGDRGPALQARLAAPQSLALDRQGNLYLADSGAGRVRVINPGGIIFTLAGGGECVPHEAGCAGTSPTEAELEPTAVAVREDGSVFLVSHLFSVFRLATEASGSHFTVAADDAWALDRFDLTGRHIDTMNTLTGEAVRHFGYDLDGRLVQVIDGPENVTTIERDPEGQPTELIAPYGQRIYFALDAEGYLSELILPGDRSYQFEYGAGGLLTRLTDPRGLVYQYAYDETGRLVRAEDPAGGYREYARSSSDPGYRVVMTTAEGTVIQYDVAPAEDGSLEMTNQFADGLRNKIRRDPDGSREIRFADGSVMQERLGPDPRWGMQSPVRQSYTYRTPSGLSYEMRTDRTVELLDPQRPLDLRRLVQETTLNDARYRFEYDALDRSLVEISPEGRQRTLRLDPGGRVVSAQLGDLLPVVYEYDTRNRLHRVHQGEVPDLRQITLDYHENGQLARLTDSLGNTVDYDYSPAGFLRQLTLPDGAAVRYAFDANANLLGLANPLAQTHAFAYSPVNLLTRYDPPTVGDPSQATRHEYDRDRRETRVVTPDGVTLQYRYDALGRLVNAVHPSGENQFAYSEATGQLERTDSPHGVSVRREYDGPLLTRESWSGLFAGEVDVGYSRSLRPRTLEIGDTAEIAYAYDADGLLIAAGNLLLERDPATGLPIRTRLHNLTSSFGYDGFGWMTTHRVVFNDIEVYAVEYSRDTQGRIISLQETVLGESHTTEYAYDRRGRLLRVDVDATPRYEYDYDANNNRIRSVDGGQATAAAYEKGDRLLSAGDVQFRHNLGGMLIERQSPFETIGYAYDPFGHLLRVTRSGGPEITYALDAEQRRAARLVNGVLEAAYLYRDRQVVAELDSRAVTRRVFVYAREDHSPDYLRHEGRDYLLVKDHLGSPRLVVDAVDGTIAQRLEYDPFGRVLADSQPGFQPFGFAGGLYDPTSGLNHFAHREYDAELGRWMSRDPRLFLGGQLNLYAYAYNDPVNHLDSDGLTASPAGAPGSGTTTVTVNLTPPPPPAGMEPGYTYLGYKVTLNREVIVDERFGKRSPDECSVHIKSITIVENSQQVGDILVTHYWGPPPIIVNLIKR